nr:MAG TPA: hypothetical protein [Caudoviricetes sp.]
MLIFRVKQEEREKVNKWRKTGVCDTMRNIENDMKTVRCIPVTSTINPSGIRRGFLLQEWVYASKMQE